MSYEDILSKYGVDSGATPSSIPTALPTAPKPPAPLPGAGAGADPYSNIVERYISPSAQPEPESTEPGILSKIGNGLGHVVGAQKSAVDALSRLGIEAATGVAPPDDLTVGKSVREALLPTVPDAEDSALRRIAGKGIEFATDVGLDPLTYELGLKGIPKPLTQAASLGFTGAMGASAIQEGGQAIDTFQREGLSPQFAEEATGTLLNGIGAAAGALHVGEAIKETVERVNRPGTTPELEAMLEGGKNTPPAPKPEPVAEPIAQPPTALAAPEAPEVFDPSSPAEQSALQQSYNLKRQGDDAVRLQQKIETAQRVEEVAGLRKPMSAEPFPESVETPMQAEPLPEALAPAPELQATAPAVDVVDAPVIVDPLPDDAIPQLAERPRPNPTPTDFSTTTGIVPSGRERGVRTVGLGITIPEQLEKQGKVSLTGGNAKDAHDIASAAQIMRDPRFETVRVVLTKGDRIVSHEARSSRMPGEASFWQKGEEGKWVKDLSDRMKLTGADGYYIIHNHPSGAPHPSRTDVNLTRMVEGKVPGFKGHVIINSGKYGVIHPRTVMAQTPEVRGVAGSHPPAIEPGVEIHSLKGWSPEQDHLLTPSIPHESLGRSIRTPADVAAVAKSMVDSADMVSVFYRDGAGKIRAIQEVPKAFVSDTDNFAVFLKEQRKAFGSTGAVAYYPRADADLAIAAKDLYKKKALRDLVMPREVKSAEGMAARPVPVEAAPSAIAAEPVPEALAHAPAPVATPEVPREAAVAATKAFEQEPSLPPTPGPTEGQGLNLNRIDAPEDRKGRLANFYQSLDSSLDRSTAQSWDSLHPEVQKHLEAPVDRLMERVGKGEILDAAATKALRTHALNESATFDQLLSDYHLAKGTEAEGAAYKAYLDQGIRQAGIEAALANNKTAVARTLASLRETIGESTGAAGKVEEHTPEYYRNQFLKNLKSQGNVTDAQITQFRQILESNPTHLPDALIAAYKPGGWAKFMHYYRASLLSGIPATDVVNTLGNVTYQGVLAADTMASGFVDKFLQALHPRSGGRERYAGEAGAEIAGIWKAAPTALRDLAGGLSDLMSYVGKGGKRPFDPAHPIEHQINPLGESAPARVIQAFYDRLNVEDRAVRDTIVASKLANKFSYRKAAQELGVKASKQDISQRAEQIRGELKLGLHDDVVRQIESQKPAAVFQERPWKGVESLIGIVNDHPWLGFVFPFLRTPSNIARAAIQHSPLGFGDGISKYRGFLKSMRKGLKPGDDGYVSRGEAADALAKPVVGTLVLGLATSAAKAGYITGGGPSDYRKKSQLLETGWQPYSFVISAKDGSKTYIPFNRIEPVAALFGAAGDIAEAKDAKTAGEVFDKALGSAANLVLSKTYLKPIADVGSFLSRPFEFGGQYIQSLAGSLIPTLVSRVEQATSPVLRETKPTSGGPMGLVERVGKTMASRVPGLSSTVPPRLGPTGEPIQRPGNAASRLLSPIQITSTRVDKGAEAAMAAADYVPSAIPTKISIPGTHKSGHVVLTSDELEIFAQNRRQTADRIERELGSGAFTRMSPEERKDYFSKRFRDADAASRSKILPAASRRYRKGE